MSGSFFGKLLKAATEIEEHLKTADAKIESMQKTSQKIMKNTNKKIDAIEKVSKKIPKI